MIFDVNAWLGAWPFRALRSGTPEALIARLDRAGIGAAAVASIDAAFHRNVQPANEQLAAAVAPYRDRLVPLAVINPTYPKWERDLAVCHERLGLRGVRLIPQYHGYELDGPLGKRVAAACRERGLSIAVPQRLEDPRERHWLDPGRIVGLDKLTALLRAQSGLKLIVLNARGIFRSPLWTDPALRDAEWYFDLSLSEIHYVLHQNLANKSELLDLIEAGGARHLVFGTHLPFSYAGPALIKRAVLPVDPDTLEAISSGTALALYGSLP